jgi:hypothetical protein
MVVSRNAFKVRIGLGAAEYAEFDTSPSDERGAGA